MTTPRAAAKRERENRLFARLLVEEYLRRPGIALPDWPSHGNKEYGTYYPAEQYHDFLRAQATHKRASAGYCYSLALKQIIS